MYIKQEVLPLGSLTAGQLGTVTELTASGAMRRRLQEIGLTPGALVECRGSSPHGDPTVYFVRGAAIALRKEDADSVLVAPSAPPLQPTADSFTVALAGNPNVGKSTVFNALTGLKQHTGNWPGKTVASAWGEYAWEGCRYRLIDLPGTYSLLSHSAEEEVARDFLCFSRPDAVVVVCDATCLERGLSLVLQAIEITPRVVVCVNLMDEAYKKGVHLDLPLLSQRLGLPVTAVSARSGEGLEALREAVAAVCASTPSAAASIRYPDFLEEAIENLTPALDRLGEEKLPARWTALHLLMQDAPTEERLRERGLLTQPLEDAKASAAAQLEAKGVSPLSLYDTAVQTLTLHAQTLCQSVVTLQKGDPYAFDRKLDRILTSRRFGIPIMLTLLGLVLWLTIWAANFPSALLASLLGRLGGRLDLLLAALPLPPTLHRALIDGVWRVLSWVVAVMLPPMAIFFPLFTLLEDFGYLPRVAFNLDHCFRRSCACGKQALTMCMGFGCNAVGVTGCRIIDSPRERLIAILTNSLVPCNGRFPTLIAMISLFFAASGLFSSLFSAGLLLGFLVLGVVLTLLCSRLLSATVLKGIPSSFTLELPPYRKPQFGKVLLRSLLDRTVFVLGRAVLVAAPAGLLIWLLANWNGGVLLAQLSALLDPLGRAMGLDGVILLAFLLGFPANEIVLPIALMIYTGGGVLVETGSLAELHGILLTHGWTALTALCVMLFSLLHFPCSTTCLTIYHETRSLRWTALAALLPTLCGVLLCMAVTAAARLTGLA